MILGVSATRIGLTDAQALWFANYLDLVKPVALHHGGCVGGDYESHVLAYQREIPIVIHPPLNERLMMDLAPWRDDPTVTILEPKEYHERDRDIVKVCNRLVAMPNGGHRPGSGTWYTADYSLSQLVPVTVCPPNGNAYRYER